MFDSIQPSFVIKHANFIIQFSAEYYTNHYSVQAYFISRFTIEAVVTFAQVLTQAILNYFMIELQMSFVRYFFLLYTLGMASTAVAVLMGAYVKDIGLAQELLPMLFVPQMLFAGFFIASDLIPSYLRWAQYLCSLTYATRLAINYEFSNCGDDIEAIENCSNLIDYTFADEFEPIIYWVILIALFIFFRLMAMISLAKSAQRFY